MTITFNLFNHSIFYFNKKKKIFFFSTLTLTKKMTWNDYQLAILIRERKERNEEYWSMPGTDRVPFWDSVTAKINIEFSSSYTSKQCCEKFQNLVRDYKVSEN